MSSSSGEFAGLAIGLIAYPIGAIAGGYLTWVYAPPVGGEFWPYIRAGAAFVGAVIGAKVALLALALVFVLLFVLLAALEVILR